MWADRLWGFVLWLSSWGGLLRLMSWPGMPRFNQPEAIAYISWSCTHVLTEGAPPASRMPDTPFPAPRPWSQQPGRRVIRHTSLLTAPIIRIFPGVLPVRSDGAELTEFDRTRIALVRNMSKYRQSGISTASCDVLFHPQDYIFIFFRFWLIRQPVNKSTGKLKIYRLVIPCHTHLKAYQYGQTVKQVRHLHTSLFAFM